MRVFNICHLLEHFPSESNGFVRVYNIFYWNSMMSKYFSQYNDFTRVLKIIFKKAPVSVRRENPAELANATSNVKTSILSYVNQNPIMLDACLRKDDPGGEP